MKQTLDKCEELGAVSGGTRIDMPGVYVKPALVELSKPEEITKTETFKFLDIKLFMRISIRLNILESSGYTVLSKSINKSCIVIYFLNSVPIPLSLNSSLSIAFFTRPSKITDALTPFFTASIQVLTLGIMPP